MYEVPFLSFSRGLLFHREIAQAQEYLPYLHKQAFISMIQYHKNLNDRMQLNKLKIHTNFVFMRENWPIY